MREIFGDMWTIGCDAICITTNSVVKRDGRAVMGAGVARQARDKHKDIDLLLGKLIELKGNRVHLLADAANEPALVSFPTKHHFREDSPIELIEQSAHQLVELVDSKGWSKVVLSRPGCGNGNLDWNMVKRRIEPILDDRFFVISRR